MSRMLTLLAALALAALPLATAEIPFKSNVVLRFNFKTNGKANRTEYNTKVENYFIYSPDDECGVLTPDRTPFTSNGLGGMDSGNFTISFDIYGPKMKAGAPAPLLSLHSASGDKALNNNCALQLFAAREKLYLMIMKGFGGTKHEKTRLIIPVDARELQKRWHNIRITSSRLDKRLTVAIDGKDELVILDWEAKGYIGGCQFGRAYGPKTPALELAYFANILFWNRALDAEEAATLPTPYKERAVPTYKPSRNRKGQLGE